MSQGVHGDGLSGQCGGHCQDVSEVRQKVAQSRSLNYTGSIDFQWDESKSDACFRTRGFDFAYAAFASKRGEAL